MVRRLAVRKILTATGVLRSTYIVATVSLALSILGMLIYLYEPSDVILMESFVWLIEAMSFGGLALAFKVAASRTIVYRARYEILRLESLAVLVAAIVAVFVSLIVAVRNLASSHVEPTPAILAAYPLLSGVTSYLLEKLSIRSLRRIELDIVAVRMIAEKLKLDIVFEIGGGLAILVSNLLGAATPERLAAVAMGAYVVYGLIGIAREAAMHLIGVVPRNDYRDMVVKIEDTLRRASRYQRIRRLRVESYGTFREVELWIEAPPGMTLGVAYRESMRIARRLVHEIPELLRALVVLVPERQSRRSRHEKRYTRSRSSARRRAAGPHGRGNEQSSQPRRAPRRHGHPQRQSGAAEHEAGRS
ncbi:cation transporter [Pyrodictium abyssi]|uniref:Cation efflux protein transmembrane domain-containing protein n=1 Tax=Pyrodictium abyssi TaxID=54256 RepID=A0ABM8IY47_9CREN|nr:hypothetical protein PABY_20010 [Pyrodictium abyssi]